MLREQRFLFCVNQPTRLALMQASEKTFLVADPWFPRQGGGHQSQNWGYQSIILAIFPRTAWKRLKLDQEIAPIPRCSPSMRQWFQIFRTKDLSTNVLQEETSSAKFGWYQRTQDGKHPLLFMQSSHFIPFALDCHWFVRINQSTKQLPDARYWRKDYCDAQERRFNPVHSGQCSEHHTLVRKTSECNCN